MVAAALNEPVLFAGMLWTKKKVSPLHWQEVLWSKKKVSSSYSQETLCSKKEFDETHTNAILDISSQAQGWRVDDLYLCSSFCPSKLMKMKKGHPGLQNLPVIVLFP